MIYPYEFLEKSLHLQYEINEAKFSVNPIQNESGKKTLPTSFAPAASTL